MAPGPEKPPRSQYPGPSAGGPEAYEGAPLPLPAVALPAPCRARSPAGLLVFRTLCATLRREEVREARLGAAIVIDRAGRRHPPPQSGIRVAVGGAAASKRRGGNYRGVSGVEWASFSFKHT